MIRAALADLGVRPDDTLFVHSDMSRWVRLAGGGRSGRLATVLDGLRGAAARGTVMMPTFTYSFCEGRSFHRAGSPSTVGALTEYFRRRPGVRRTADPLFSAAILGPVSAAWESALFAVCDKDCFGDRSVFAYLLWSNAAVVFLGSDPDDCTFLLHVEQLEQVPYRYFKEFRGEVTDGEPAREVTARYFVRDLDADVVSFLRPLMDALRDRRELVERQLDGGPTIGVARARAIASAARAGLRANPDYLLTRGHRATV